MLNRRLKGTFVLALAVVLGVALLAPAASHAADKGPIALMTAAQGAVSIERPSSPAGQVIPVRAGTREDVFAGDVVRTGPDAKAKLLLKDDSLITLSEDAELEVTEALYEPAVGRRSTTVKVLNGLARAVVQPVPENYEDSLFKIVTPTAVMGVRGSEGIVEVSRVGKGYKVTFWAIRSTWDVSSSDPSLPGVVKVSPGQFTEVLMSRIPEAPRPIPRATVPKLKRATTLMEVAFTRPTPHADKGPPIGPQMALNMARSNSQAAVKKKAKSTQAAKDEKSSKGGPFKELLSDVGVGSEKEQKKGVFLAGTFQGTEKTNNGALQGNKNGLALGNGVSSLGASILGNPQSGQDSGASNGLGNGVAGGVGNGPPVGAGGGPPISVVAGPPAGVGGSPGAGVSVGPSLGLGGGPPAGFGSGPPAGVGGGPPAGVGGGPPAGKGGGPPPERGSGKNK